MGDVEIRTLAVVGAGLMGSGIAESGARAGLDVVLYEPEHERLEHSKSMLDRSLERARASGTLQLEAATELRARITWTTDFDLLQQGDLVIEAVVEDALVKGDVFEQLDQSLPGDVLLASNTSSIPIAQLASRTDRRDRVLGLHFFSPVPVMKLVEVVVGIDTSEATLARAEAFVRTIGKTAIRTKDRSGFIVNMLLVPYLMAAVRMYEEGFASREAIDDGMRLGCGHPMGPLTLCDFIGLDVLYAVCDSLYEEFKRPEYAPPPLLKRMVVSGRHGRKSGGGFYDYAATPTRAAAHA
jgi:3-hydroxybutyryl-CoA dehydrogenase